MLSVIGGKITTYRKLAEDALKLVADKFPNTKAPWTATASLPGGDIDEADFDAFEARCAIRYPWLESETRHRLARTYGTRVHTLLGDAQTQTELGHHYGGGLYQKEVDYLIAREFARTPEDILMRRTKLGLHLTSAEQTNLHEQFTSRLVAQTRCQPRHA